MWVERRGGGLELEVHPGLGGRLRGDLAAVHHEAHALGLLVLVVADEAHVVAGVGLLAGLDLVHDAVDVGLAEHRQLPQVPVVQTRELGLRVLDRAVPALVDDVLDLLADLLFRQLREVGEGPEPPAGGVLDPRRVVVHLAHRSALL